MGIFDIANRTAPTVAAPSTPAASEIDVSYIDGVFSDTSTPTPPEPPSMERTLSDSLFSVSRQNMGSDPLVTAMGSSFVAAGEELARQKDIVDNFYSPLRILATSTTKNQAGTVTSMQIQSIKDTINLKPIQGANYLYTAYDIPVAPVSSATTKYNFFVKDYENFITSEPDNPEYSMLPALGTLLSLDGMLNESAEQRDRDGQPIARDFSIATEVSFRESQDENLQYQYFSHYAQSLPVQELKYKNIIFPEKKIVYANSAHAAAKDSFPFHVSFDINLAQCGELCENLIDTGFADSFVTSVAASIENGENFQRYDFVDKDMGGTLSKSPRVFDPRYLVENVDNTFAQKCVVMGTEDDFQSAFPGIAPTFSQYLDAIRYLLKSRDILGNRQKTFEDILDGTSDYSEVVLYRIAKFRDSEPGTPLQNFYFFNTPDASVFNFIDSQAVPGVLYNYKVYSYSYVCATSYEYEEVLKSASSTIEEGNYSVVVRTAPVSRLVEKLIYETDAYVASLPPVTPGVEFRSFIGDGRKLQILFEENPIDIIAQPVALEEGEEYHNTLLRESQGVAPTSPLMFSNDDETKVYEIYRTSVPPTSVDSFAGKLHRRTTTKAILEPVQGDKTYYYMFRSIDNHGNVSNPSSAFEVTLMAGFSPYLLVSEYSYPMVDVNKRTRQKGMKRFLRVKPSTQQLRAEKSNLENKQSSLDVNNVELGDATTGQVWGKKYKIRIISKETGKKIDFNLEYDYNFEYRDE